ncbi:hypothetical protein B0H34DRAFT_69086 [Crassisporium funariophilum]|nr:hypothetical protein B0H34DRAFT_69086 [Crassisporium funariophilum]
MDASLPRHALQGGSLSTTDLCSKWADLLSSPSTLHMFYMGRIHTQIVKQHIIVFCLIHSNQWYPHTTFPRTPPELYDIPGESLKPPGLLLSLLQASPYVERNTEVDQADINRLMDEKHPAVGPRFLDCDMKSLCMHIQGERWWKDIAMKGFADSPFEYLKGGEQKGTYMKEPLIPHPLQDTIT